LFSYTDEVIPVGIKVQYVGIRPYTEFNLDGVRTGFSRGMIRELPKSLVNDLIRPSIEAGSNMWVIVEDTETKKTEAMKSVVEESTPLNLDEEVEPDYESMKRTELMALCKEEGITTKNTDKKADLIDKLTA